MGKKHYTLKDILYPGRYWELPSGKIFIIKILEMDSFERIKLVSAYVRKIKEINDTKK